MLNKLKATIKHLQKKRDVAKYLRTLQQFDAYFDRMYQELDQPKR